MATKAERFHAADIISRSLKKRQLAPKATRTPVPDKPHNLGARAGRNARVSYETSATSPSRKSTRGSAHHQRATNQLERTEQLKQNRPVVRARLARAQAIKVRGSQRKKV
jgi:hypothetical protein